MKNRNKTKKVFKYFIISFVLTIFASLVFAFENPNFLYEKGFFFLAYFSYIPVLFVIHNSSLKNVWFYGGLYGALSYFFFAFWLINYNPLCMIIACSVYFIILSLVFLLLKYADLIFVKSAWLVQFLIILSYEYLKTPGFLGYNYGVTAYTQWNFTPVIQICDITGVFGLNALIIFPSCVIYAIIQKSLDKRFIRFQKDTDNSLYDCDTHINYVSKYDQALRFSSIKIPVILLSVWIVLFAMTLSYGYFFKKDYSNNRQMTVAAIQHNEDPSLNGNNENLKNLKVLMNLSDEAKGMNPDIKLIIWPETAVVPSIVNNYKSDNKEKSALVDDLLSYLNKRECSFVIGNNHVVKENNKVLDYNSALYFENRQSVYPPNPEIYSKMHLVPFSEEIPWDGKLKDYLLKNGSFIFAKGSRYVNFNKDGLVFSVLICFEDTFTDIARKNVINGARCFINLSNDAWAKEESCQYQHLAMAVFRSVENRVPSIRSTASGQTCIINPDGSIKQMAPAFCKTYVIDTIPVIDVHRKNTFYTRTGDIIALSYCILTGLLLLIKTIIVIINNNRNKNG
ncbi:MAG: apolipoprotein N-acyltransferase [Treponema sp.]|nr:apolipoprotein N-acyltransferase [Treponema sp.]